MLKIHNQGRTIDDLPHESILRDADSPEEVVRAFEAWRESVEALREPTKALREAEKVAQESTLLVRGERDRWLAEIAEKTAEESMTLRRAERVSRRSALDFVEVLKDDEHAHALRAVGARLALEVHVRAVDAAVEIEETRVAFRLVAPRGLPDHRMVDPVMDAHVAGTNVQRGPLEALDTVNTHALADLARTRLGMVEIASEGGTRLLTTPRRAAVAVEGSGSGPFGLRGWALVEEREVA